MTDKKRLKQMTQINSNRLQKGQYVVPIKWKEGDRSFEGEVLQIQSVSLPFAIASRHFCNSTDRDVTIDTRQSILVYPTSEYINRKRNGH